MVYRIFEDTCSLKIEVLPNKNINYLSDVSEQYTESIITDCSYVYFNGQYLPKTHIVVACQVFKDMNFGQWSDIPERERILATGVLRDIFGSRDK